MRLIDRLSTRLKLGLGGAALLAVGFAAGSGAVSLTRPAVAMAPTVPTAVARLAAAQGIVTVKGRVAEVYGDRFVVQDGTGRALVAAGRDGAAGLNVGAPVLVQGRFDQGQLRAQFLVDGHGRVEEVGPPHRHGPHGGPPLPHHGEDGPPPPPPGGPGAPPPPPPGGPHPGSPPPPPGAQPSQAPAPAAVPPKTPN